MSGEQGRTGEQDEASGNSEAGEHGKAGDGAATRLERLGRMLLRCYPPAYRHGRGEEILGTLLEATAPGRTWPSPRDAWSLVRGGLRARAARNRQVGLATSLRQAALLGFALFATKDAGEQFEELSYAHHPVTAGPVPLLAGCLLMAAVVAAWTGRRALSLAAAIAACPILAWREYTYRQGIPFFRLPATEQAGFGVWLALALVALAALVVLSRDSERPPLSWLSLPGVVLALAIEDRFWHYLRTHLVLHDQLATIVCALFLPTLIWLVTDARPALGLAVLLLVAEMLAVINGAQAAMVLNESAGAVWQAYGMNLVGLVLAAGVTGAGTWLLRRQTRKPRPA